MFKVIVPYKRDGKVKEVSYPGKGHRLYSREEALTILRKFVDQDTDGRRGDGGELEPYAESDDERFTLEVTKMEPKKTTAYCVKYALTQGIYKMEGEIREGVRFCIRDPFFQSFSERDFDTTLDGAKAKAEALRVKKIASLKKQLTKLEKLEIKVNE